MFTFTIQRKLSELYPNVFIPLRITVTIPATAAQDERNFSRLKLVKTCLRTTMAQDRRTGLAISHYSDILGSFRSRKRRGSYFRESENFIYNYW
jgi:hypothetical protein